VSTFRFYTTSCPACGHRFEVEIARGLHITRLPDIREKLIDGSFQVHACPACGQSALYEATVVYTDFERGEYIATETTTSASWQAALSRHQTMFRDCFEAGPPVVQDMAARFKRRVVFGFRALREKLVLWDAGLDDRIVEAVKGDVLRDEGESPREVVLRIARVLDGGHLLFAAYEPVRPPEDLPAGEPWVVGQIAPHDFLTAPAARYAARAAEPSAIARDYPWLADDWLVDLHDGPSYLYR
jgi:predicted RNA-binding Zn-ribbon protein involved in translation (DUF1610 family)